jgi:phytoene synthase
LPSSIRAAFAALWNLDLAFADVVSTTSDTRLGAIRLAWWREQLDELDESVEVPNEPRLQAVARELLPRGVAGGELSRLEDGWLPLLDPFPWGKAQADGLRLRGRLLFTIGARLIGDEGSDAGFAGELWSLEDGARHCSDEQSRAFLMREASSAMAKLPLRIGRRLRPLTVLAALAACAVSRTPGFGRGGAAIRHRLTGRFPR